MSAACITMPSLWAVFLNAQIVLLIISLFSRSCQLYKGKKIEGRKESGFDSWMKRWRWETNILVVAGGEEWKVQAGLLRLIDVRGADSFPAIVVWEEDGGKLVRQSGEGHEQQQWRLLGRVFDRL